MLFVYDLKTEYLVNPLGVDAVKPRFSWKLRSAAQGMAQVAYRIVARDDTHILWDSGRVESHESQRILYAGEPLVSRQRVEWHLAVETEDETGHHILAEVDSWFRMGLLKASDWKGKWIEPEREVDREARKPVQYLRKCFSVAHPVRSAYIYQTAQGLYEFWINGEKGSLDCFKPGLTSYYYRLQYQVYDVTKLLKQGENVWAVMLGDGWWRGSTGGTVKNNFGYRLAFLGQLEITYEDGGTEWIGTDESFVAATGGLRASDMLWGDEYDARKEPSGWRLPGFEAHHWNAVKLQEESKISKLIPSRSVPVREKERFYGKPFYDKAGKLVIDFGQNIAGYVKCRFRNCREGQRIHLVHGEDMDAQGCFSVKNINQCSVPQPFFQEIFYTCVGDDLEEYKPIFSVFGFRYLLVEGYEGKIESEDFVAYAVYSDLEETGDFVCSNDLINQLVKNSRWSQKGNFLDVAVDCPTRERNAWTGDNQIYVRTACYFMNVYPFYEKWLQDQAIEQYASGKLGITFPSTSSVHNPQELVHMKKVNPLSELAGPEGNGNIGEDCAGWGDSAAWIPYSLYRVYGDRRIVENQYATARRWVDYMLKNSRDHNPYYEDQPQYHHFTDGVLDADYIYDTRMHYGEWQEPIAQEAMEGSLAEAFAILIREGKPLVATAYMARSADNVADMAGILGLREEENYYKETSRRIKTVYAKYFIDEEGVIEPGHQASYVRALAFGLCGDKRPLVERQLVREIEKNGYRLNTGFLSTPFLLPVLCDMGRADLAFRILEQTENPSWLHPVLLGATTIPESWDGFDRHDGSLNHYSYGAVCEFLFGYVAGIRPMESAPGYQRFILQPVCGGTLTWAEGIYESLYGRIKSAWRLEGNIFRYTCEIPVNTKALVILPDGSRREIGSGKYEFWAKI